MTPYHGTPSFMSEAALSPRAVSRKRELLLIGKGIPSRKNSEELISPHNVALIYDVQVLKKFGNIAFFSFAVML